MRQKELLIIGITVFLTVVAWIAADLYHIAKTEQVKLDAQIIGSTTSLEVNIDVLDDLLLKK